MKLERRYVEKPWGRPSLPEMFELPAGKTIGEVWFAGDGDLPLLAKYIFTSEPLSIQVHPETKTECWYVLDADRDATIGLGLRYEVSGDQLRAAALDGSIEQLVDRRLVLAGDFFFVPAGTIHAIGGGISLIEIQQNLDLTYRLYDYGRPRELHLDEGLAVAEPGPWSPVPAEGPILADGGAFRVERWTRGGRLNGPAVVVPLAGAGTIDGEALATGACWNVEGEAEIAGEGIDLLAAFPA